MPEVSEVVAALGWVQKAVGVLASSAALVKTARVEAEEGAERPQRTALEAGDHWWAAQMERR